MTSGRARRFVVLLTIGLLASLVDTGVSRLPARAAHFAAVRSSVEEPSGLDMHDGTVVQYGSTYYMYGTQYSCGFSWGTPNTPFCGFAVRTAAALSGPWSAPHLLFLPTANANTTGSNWAGDNGETWNWICGSTGSGCFNPRMVRRPDGVWVLWFNAPGDYSRTKANAYWAMGCNGPLGPCGSSAGAPHGTDHKPSLGPCGVNGDFSIVTSGSNAEILCSHAGQISEEQLTSWWTDGTGQGTTGIALSGVATAEGVGAFQLADGSWEMTYSNPQCGYCSGPPALKSAGGATETRTGYATAPSLDGPWTAQGDVSTQYCTGQPRTVFYADGRYWEWIDRWTGARNETTAGIGFEAMNSTPWSCT